MAYSPSLLRVPCSADCTCRQMDPITLRNLVCYDSRIMNDMAEIENPHDDDIEDEDLQFDMDIFSYSFFPPTATSMGGDIQISSVGY